MPSQFHKSLTELRALLANLDTLEAPLTRAAEMIAECLLNGGKLLLCGNGGSAADSSHFSSEITCRFRDDRRPYPSIALAADAGLLTAIANDYSFDEIFARQVWAYGKPGDILIAFTTSGRSPNILAALDEARRRGLRTIAFLGRGGAEAAGQADVELSVPAQCTTTARIQEAHKFLLHVLCEILEDTLPK